MPSGIGAKIQAICGVVRRVQTFSSTTAGATLAAISTIFFLPSSLPVRVALFIPGLLYFSRKVYVFVYSRHALGKLTFEATFLTHGADPEQLAESLSPKSRIWERSAVVSAVRAMDVRPALDRSPESAIIRRLEHRLKQTCGSMMLPRPSIDHMLFAVWLGMWIYHAILHPGPHVVSATILLMSGLFLFVALAWVELAFNLAVGEQRKRLYSFYWDLSSWLYDQFSEIRERRSRVAPYRRTEHYRDRPWFPDTTSGRP